MSDCVEFNYVPPSTAGVSTDHEVSHFDGGQTKLAVGQLLGAL